MRFFISVESLRRSSVVLVCERLKQVSERVIRKRERERMRRKK
jgi:hypothetical protein